MIRDGLFLHYRVEGSTGPAETRTSDERFTFRRRPDGRFQVDIDAEQVRAGLYTQTYGDPIIVDVDLMDDKGRVLQFDGLCPLILAPLQRATDAEATWVWDGAGVSDPDERLVVRGAVRGPIRWRRWSIWMLQRTDIPPSAPSPVSYYEEVTGLLVGVDYGAVPGAGRFVYCDAELQASAADGL
jgi:hypothetical protein